MNFEELQQNWQEQDSGKQVTVDQDALHKLVQRERRSFDSTIFRRDSIEIGIGLALLPIWIWMGVRSELPWTWYLVIPGILFVVGFLIRDRIAQKQNQSQPGDSVRKSTERALAQVEHQIVLLKNVFWWYLFPISLTMAIFFVHISFLDRSWWELANKSIFVGLIYWGIYELNQRAVRKDLAPRAGELRNFLDSLEEPESEDAPPASND